MVASKSYLSIADVSDRESNNVSKIESIGGFLERDLLIFIINY